MSGRFALYMAGDGTWLARLELSVLASADADHDYGNAIDVMRTVREYIQTGVAGRHQEDPDHSQALRPRGGRAR